jgi:hypothetical protein
MISRSYPQIAMRVNDEAKQDKTIKAMLLKWEVVMEAVGGYESSKKSCLECVSFVKP